jgi:beta-N-acetylhexosaminidase
MSTRDKAAQMVMPWISGGLAAGSPGARRAARWATELRVGGFIVGKGERGATTRSLARLLRAAGGAPGGVPLLLASDLEWGAGMRLLGGTLLPPLMAVGAAGDTALAHAHGLATAREGRAAGINVALAPALDVNVNPANPIINTRSLGGQAATVARLGAATVRGLQAGGLVAVGKHFPGHGDTDQDSHLTLPSITGTRARLDSVELAPFRAAVRAGMGGVLVGHIAAPALTGDQTPASLSPAVITRLIRAELGFEGLVFTDALNMDGVAERGTSAEVALAAVRAGADVLLQPPEPERAVAAIVRAVERGEVSAARLDASVRRILAAKRRLGLLPGAGAASLGTGAAGGADPAADAAGVARRIARRSITLLRDSAARLPVRGGRPVLALVYAGTGAPADAGLALDAALRARGLDVRRRVLTARTAPVVADSLVAAWNAGAAAPLVVLSTYTQAIPWAGAIGLPPAVARGFERLAARAPIVHAVFGDPYVVGGVPSASTVLLAWSGIGVAQQAAAAALAGDAPITGRLPVAIPPRYGIGDGMDNR